MFVEYGEVHLINLLIPATFLGSSLQVVKYI